MNLLLVESPTKWDNSKILGHYKVRLVGISTCPKQQKRDIKAVYSAL